MNIKPKNILADFSPHIDWLNTIGGGVSMTTVTIQENTDTTVINLSAPSVSPEAFTVFVDGNKLIVYSELKQSQENESEAAQAFRVPLFNRIFDLPHFVNANEIEAVYESGELKVILPHQEAGPKIQRKIDIKY
jgi:HSP20 family protein